MQFIFAWCFCAYVLRTNALYELPNNALANYEPADIILSKRNPNLILDIHNRIRSKHHQTSPLVYDKSLQDRARNIVNTISDAYPHKVYFSSTGVNINIMQSTSKDERMEETSIENWYAESSQYDYFSVINSAPDFTQMIWAESKSVGCWSIVKRSMKAVYYSFFVCVYSPPGNVKGAYLQNVNLPKDSWWSRNQVKCNDSNQNCSWYKDFCHYESLRLMLEELCPKTCGFCF